MPCTLIAFHKTQLQKGFISLMKPLKKSDQLSVPSCSRKGPEDSAVPKKDCRGVKRELTGACSSLQGSPSLCSYLAALPVLPPPLPRNINTGYTPRAGFSITDDPHSSAAFP